MRSSHSRARLFSALTAPSAGLPLLALLMLSACGSTDEPAEAAPAPEGQEVQVPDIARTSSQGGITLPTIVTLTPAGEELGVDPDTDIAIAFNVELQPASVTNAFTVTTAGVGVTGTTSYDAALKTITFDPDKSLPSGSVVVVKCASVISTQNVSTDPLQWQFTTAN